MDDELLTTADAARLAGVGTTSVKRWADANLLPCVKTAGGHRRFRRADLERFLREQAVQGSPAEGSHSPWLRLMLHAGQFELQGEILRARDRLGAWFRVAEELGAGLHELGQAWERGEITVIEEHIASEKLARALERVVESMPGHADDPSCLLVCAEGDEHTLGLSLLELCLRESGWASIWAGRKTPLNDALALVADGRARMLALSASIASSDARALAAQARRASDACAAAGVMLVVGGAGAWPRTLHHGQRFHDLASFAHDARQWRRELS